MQAPLDNLLDFSPPNLGQCDVKGRSSAKLGMGSQHEPRRCAAIGKRGCSQRVETRESFRGLADLQVEAFYSLIRRSRYDSVPQPGPEIPAGTAVRRREQGDQPLQCRLGDSLANQLLQIASVPDPAPEHLLTAQNLGDFIRRNAHMSQGYRSSEQAARNVLSSQPSGRRSGSRRRLTWRRKRRVTGPNSPDAVWPSYTKLVG